MFTFKTVKSIGRWRSFDSDQYQIKWKKKEVGLIIDVSELGGPGFDIRFMVDKKDINEDGNPNCSWRWIGLKKRCNTLRETKEWLNQNFEVLCETYKFHLTD